MTSELVPYSTMMKMSWLLALLVRSFSRPVAVLLLLLEMVVSAHLIRL